GVVHVVDGDLIRVGVQAGGVHTGGRVLAAGEDLRAQHARVRGAGEVDLRVLDGGVGLEQGVELRRRHVGRRERLDDGGHRGALRGGGGRGGAEGEAGPQGECERN